jgi:AraC-like DNA-binding protein
MQPQPFIQVDQIQPLLDLLQGTGAPLACWLDQVGIPECVLLQPGSILPVSRFIRLLELATADLGPELGIEIANQSGIEQLGSYGHAIVHARTFGRALATASRYSRLVNSSQSIVVTPLPDGIRWRLAFDSDLGEGLRQIEAFAVVATIRLIRRVAGPEWDPAVIRVQPVVAQVMRQYDKLARCRIEESSGPAEMIIQRYVLARPLGGASALQDRLQALAALKELAVPTRLEPILQRLVVGLLPAGGPSLEMLADLVGVRPRTLQRRLAERQTSLTDLVDQIRIDRSLQILTASSGSVARAARECGYTDPANFTRAFRRWTGYSPREYRLSLASA